MVVASRRRIPRLCCRSYQSFGPHDRRVTATAGRFCQIAVDAFAACRYQVAALYAEGAGPIPAGTASKTDCSAAERHTFEPLGLSSG